MDRLRSLFSNAGLANLHRSHEPLQQEQQPPTRQAVADKHRAPAREFDPAVASPSMQAAAEKTPAPVPEAKVIAKPEILSPREFIPVKGSGRKVDAEVEADNDILILPAKRGQYTSR